MARYIKANPKVAQFLRVENERNRVKDGNYLLWQADILPLGRLTDLPQILEQIGGIALMAHEAKQEQDGTVLRELPTAKDPRFIVEKYETPADGGTQNNDAAEPPAEQQADGADESEKSSDVTKEPTESAVGETASAESETPNTETV